MITKLFKSTKLKVAIRTSNTIKNLLNAISPDNKYEFMGIYRLVWVARNVECLC
jgi:hypothetical protein